MKPFFVTGTHSREFDSRTEAEAWAAKIREIRDSERDPALSAYIRRFPIVVLPNPCSEDEVSEAYRSAK